MQLLVTSLAQLRFTRGPLEVRQATETSLMKPLKRSMSCFSPQKSWIVR